jgi:hypothetical protein
MVALMGALSAAAVCCGQRPLPPKGRANVMLVYVGAEDCGPGAGVPLWFVISGDEHVEWAFGASQWQAAVLPRLRRLLH